MSVDVLALVRKAAAAALNAQAEVVQESARINAPTDTGALDESIKVTKARANDLVAQVYTNAEHALYQHEQLDLVHKTGRSKFLEAAALEGKAAIESAGAAAARKALG